MKRNKGGIFLRAILFFILFGSPCWATDYYFNPDVTTSGNGLSWATAWKAFANINWTTLNTGTNTLYFSGSTTSRTYTGTLTIEHTGSGVLTIRPGSASPSPSGHQGQVIFGTIYLGSSNYVRNLTISGETIVGSGTRNMKSGVIHAMAPIPSGFPYTYVKILYMEINGGGGSACDNHCIDFEPDTRGNEVGYCYIHNCAGGAVNLSNAQSHNSVEFGDNLMHHNQIGDTTNDGLEVYFGGWDIYNNTLGSMIQSDCHADGISAALNNKVRIFNNTIYDYGQGIFLSFFGSNVSKLYIYNNVFYWRRSGWTTPAIMMRNTNGQITADSVRIVNNTFDVAGDVGAIVFSMSNDDYRMTMTNWIIANNIFLPTTAVNFMFTERSGQAHVYTNTDLKIYRNVYEESSVKSSWHTTDYGTLANWNTVTGASGGNANKQCVTSMVNKSGYDYHLQSGDTCAKNQGLDLATTYGWTDMGVGWGYDKDGVARPTGAWSIGAYEYNLGGAPSPPRNLSITQ